VLYVIMTLTQKMLLHTYKYEYVHYKY